MLPSRQVVISGCSGGGKSTLLAELEARGYMTVPEPGRRIVRAERRGDGTALPWVNLAGFAERALEMAAGDRERVSQLDGWAFFDRGLVDAAVALEYATGRPAARALAGHDRYHHCVFLAPPWPEIFLVDAERADDFDGAVGEYGRLERTYRALGYELRILPKSPVRERCDFVLGELGLPSSR